MTMISDIMDGVLYVDAERKVKLINPVAEQMLGIKAFMVLGRSAAELDQNNELCANLQADQARVREEGQITRTIEVLHDEMDVLYIQTATSAVLDHKSEFAGALTVMQDVTSNYKSDQLKNQYLSIVAHELRTPLTGIKTFSTMMVQGSLGELSDDQQEVMESIREQSLRLEHQIDKLINLGYLESNEYGQDTQVVDVCELVHAAAAPFEQVAKDRSIEMRIDVPASPPGQLLSVQADQADLKRCIQAMIENAVKFTPDGGTVDVAVQTRDGQVEFAVADTGIGIDPRYQRRIFEKFFQVEDPLTRHHGGAGLGLFVAQGVLDAHGSRIEVESELGKGARFTFWLPKFDEKGGSDLDPAMMSSTQVTQEA